MFVTGNGNPRSLSLCDPARVGLCSSHADGSLTGRLESRFLFMLLVLDQMSLMALAGECFFCVHQQADEKLAILLFFLYLGEVTLPSA